MDLVHPGAYGSCRYIPTVEYGSCISWRIWFMNILGSMLHEHTFWGVPLDQVLTGEYDGSCNEYTEKYGLFINWKIWFMYVQIQYCTW